MFKLICMTLAIRIFCAMPAMADETVSPDSIKIILAKNVMQVGETQRTTISVLPANAEYELVYHSSNPDVVTAAIGTLIAVSAGTAEITVSIKDTELCDKVTVTVGDEQNCVPVADIVPKHSSLQLQRYDEVKLYYDILPANATNQTVLFTSLDTTIATVDKNGLIYGRRAGTTKIMLQTEDKTITRYVNVTVEDGFWSDSDYGNIAVRRIEIYDGDDEVIKTIEIMQTKSKRLNAHIYPENASDKRIRWRSSDNGIANVDENGIVTGISEGTVKVYAIARDSGRQDVVTIKVTPYVRFPDSISIVPQENAVFETGNTIKFHPVFYPLDTTEKDLKWMVLGNCATIDQNGMVLITDKGTVTVKAYTADGKLSAEFTLEARFGTKHFALVGESYNVRSDRPMVITFDETVNIYAAKNYIFAAKDEAGNADPIDVSVTIMDKQVVVMPINGWGNEGCYLFIKGNACDIYGNRLGKNLKYKIVNVRE